MKVEDAIQTKIQASYVDREFFGDPQGLFAENYRRNYTSLLAQVSTSTVSTQDKPWGTEFTIKTVNEIYIFTVKNK